MKSLPIFQQLDTTESTNNYAMGYVHAGMAKHGMAWFAHKQTAGKGQRGKQWVSNSGENILLSVAFNPPKAFFAAPFLFNALITNTCFRFFASLLSQEMKIKWPNDLMIRDRKAGGLLIENNYLGADWRWAVVGIGFNINQEVFPSGLRNPISLKMATGKTFDPVYLAQQLQLQLINAVSSYQYEDRKNVMAFYNDQLYFRNQVARFRKKNMVFDSKVLGVNEQGQLLTEDAIPRQFEFGELEWIFE